MKFSINARIVAEDRQDRNDGWGPWCAKCCENIGLAESYVIPRIPIAKGGSLKADNCVILCEKCYGEIGEHHTETIPYRELQCFEIKEV